MKSTKSKQIHQIINSISESSYFQQAFTHSSYCHENHLSPNDSYENLEFFGDSILSFQVSRYVYHNFPEFSEGQMSKLKQLMVQESTLANLSKEIGLARYLRLGTGERKNHGLEKNSILADVFESLLAALYLTKGERTTHRFLNLTLFTWIKGKENLTWDYKSQLQEYCQAQKNWVRYQLKEIQKKDNERWFIMEVSDKLQTFSARGVGKTKKEAEQIAAGQVLKKLGVIS